MEVGANGVGVVCGSLPDLSYRFLVKRHSTLCQSSVCLTTTLTWLEFLFCKGKYCMNKSVCLAEAPTSNI